MGLRIFVGDGVSEFCGGCASIYVGDETPTSPTVVAPLIDMVYIVKTILGVQLVISSII